MRQKWSLFTTFAQIGAFTFGGGYAMIPLIQREVVDRRQWVDPEEFVELLTLAQMAPGPISLNTAVFVGYKIGGYWGAIMAVLGTILPSFVVILLIALNFSSIREHPTVNAIFKGVRPAVVALIIAPLVTLSKGLGWKRAIVAILAALTVWKLGLSPMYLLLIGTIGGMLYGWYNQAGVEPQKKGK